MAKKELFSDVDELVSSLNKELVEPFRYRINTVPECVYC